jgi:hypothetical protein
MGLGFPAHDSSISLPGEVAWPGYGVGAGSLKYQGCRSGLGSFKCLPKAWELLQGDQQGGASLGTEGFAVPVGGGENRSEGH